ncbi:glycosyltransferase family 4 protein [Pseudoleptotrichia goodfellowii]|uniref:Glycosyltransferase, group 1 family protein n=1 Tax=Pseudoleptotrichia goodfellowii TaxID=157692 RepID=A0A510JDJ5_9FUSO|nr:glycosyltransferase family 1 protein [Pseudoleptotrichia goodfellowii]BBM37294.1 glycosyltransferase, group 1 family protein [Pseudoleptotrichia goodfellowii]
MKKISLELQWAIGEKTGIGWYIYNIVKELSKSDKNEYIAEFINFMGRHNIKSQINYDLRIRQNRFLTYTMYNFLTKKMNISHNLILGTKSNIYHFFNFTIPKNIKGKVINTIYDTVFITAPETMGDMKKIEEYRYGAEKSDLIITISESAKEDIIKNLNINENKIKIVYPGIDIENYFKKCEERELEIVRKKYSLPKNYILYLGTIEPRKNIERIINSFLKYKKKNNDDLKLVLSGRKGWKYENIMNLIKSSPTDIIFTDYIEEKDKKAIYKMAKIFVFPSLYEGFGMPVLEAMAAGVPVITSNISSLPEVAGDACILVNPLEEEEILKGYEKVIFDSNFRNNMIKKGIEQSKKYQWKESAKQLEKIYDEI